jgi:predicted AlkP superfamily pyrophosphatase or phosphodiesterase
MKFKSLVALGLTLFTSFSSPQLLAESSHSLPLQKYLKKPQLVVVVVIDQFRADYLTRFEKRFLKHQGGTQGGFNFLMNDSAYYPYGEYDVAQSMTCPGHAMILTGSHPHSTGIPLNEWYDRKTDKMVYCTDDLTLGEPSPNYLKTTTVGDELKNSGRKSKNFSVALKDRSAIMLGGHRADLAIWMDYKTFTWRSSKYYTETLPTWLKEHNKELEKNAGHEMVWKSTAPTTGLSENAEGPFEKKFIALSKQGLALNYGIQVTLDVAAAAMKKEKLGKTPGSPDMLTISLSSHDMLGHGFGPNSRELEELTVYEDRALAKFFSQVKEHMGSYQDVVFVLTADHGIPPTVDYLKKNKIDGGKIDYLEVYKTVYRGLDEKFGTPKKGEWFKASRFLNFYLNDEIIREKKLTSAEVQEEIKKILASNKSIAYIVTQSDIEHGKLPPGEWGEAVKRQNIPTKSGDIFLFPRPFYVEKDDNLITHMSGYSYDKTVPIIIKGAMVKSGVYASKGKVIDIAPTLSFILGIIPPATNEGRVLSEIF